MEPLHMACHPEHTRWRVTNDSVGIAERVAQLHQRKPALLVLEAAVGLAGRLGGRPGPGQSARGSGEPSPHPGFGRQLGQRPMRSM